MGAGGGGQSRCWFPPRKINSQPVRRTNKHLHLKARGAMDARDKPASFTRMKDKYQLQKGGSPPEHTSRGRFHWVYRIGLWIDHRRRREKHKQKPAFQRVGVPPGFPFLQSSNQTDGSSCSPADTRGRGPPRGPSAPIRARPNRIGHDSERRNMRQKELQSKH